MKWLKSLAYWSFIYLALVLIFAESYDSLGKSAYFVTLLIPVIFFTDYAFNTLLVPRYLFGRRYKLFAIYTLCLLVISIYLETWAVSLAFILIAKFDYTHMLTATKDVFVLALSMYAIVLLNAFIRVFRHYQQQQSMVESMPVTKPETDPSITILCQRKHVVISLSEIVYLESMADYVKVHQRQAVPVITKKRIGQFEEDLPASFLRIHRSFIINLLYLESYTNEEAVVNGQTLTISRKYKQRTLEKLRSLSLTPGS